MDKNVLEQRIGTLCRKVIDDKGWKTFQDIQVKAVEQPFPMSAFITLTDRRINVNVSEDLYKEINMLKDDEKISKDTDSIIEPLTYFGVVHEYGHHQYCPRTREDLQQILEGVFEAVHGREFDSERIRELCLDIQNMFSDTILNTINAHTDDNKEEYREGFDTFYILSANDCKRKRLGKTSKGFTLFLNSNELLCNTSLEISEKMKKYLPKFFPGFSRYRKKILNVFTGDKGLTKKVLERRMDEEDVEKLVNRFKDTSLWKQMAYDYSNIIYPFMKQLGQGEADSLDNSFSKDSPSSTGRRSSKKKPTPKDGKDKRSSSDKKCDKNCGIGKKKDPIDDLLDKLKNPHIPYTSPFLYQFARLDSLYRARAGKLALYAQEENSPSLQHEEKMSVEEMPLEEFETRDVDWASTRILKKNDGTKHVELYRQTTPLILPFESEEKPIGIPDLSFIFDSSGSMNFEPFEGEGKGQYHFAVLAFYSILNYLEKEGLAPLLNYYSINFSKTTYSSGWCSYSEINKVKSTLFDYQGGGTALEPAVLQDLRVNRRDNLISFMLSDTDFNFKENETQVIQEIDKILATGGIGFYLFQIGLPTTFSKAMEERNVPVQYVKSAEDFMNKAIRFSKDLYGELLRK